MDFWGGPYLPDGTQQIPVAVHYDQEQGDKSGDEQADDVWDVIYCFGCPVYWAGAPRSLGAIVAPAKERWGRVHTREYTQVRAMPREIFW